MLIPRGEQGVVMGLGLGAAGEQLATFSSIVDGEVFLCLKSGTKHSAVSSQLSACFFGVRG